MTTWKSASAEEILADIDRAMEAAAEYRQPDSERVVRFEADQGTYDWLWLWMTNIVENVGIHAGTQWIGAVPLVVVEDFEGLRAVYADGHTEDFSAGGSSGGSSASGSGT
jgi:hypothetical protein